MLIVIETSKNDYDYYWYMDRAIGIIDDDVYDDLKKKKMIQNAHINKI